MTALLAMNDDEQLALGKALTENKVKILDPAEQQVLKAWHNYFENDEIVQARNLLLLVSLCLENGIEPTAINNAITPLSCFIVNMPRV